MQSDHLYNFYHMYKVYINICRFQHERCKYNLNIFLFGYAEIKIKFYMPPLHK
uniref:Uncharacterized protein n=1 Tax=Arundo donax TaxID=35708 RepID=A0A0A8XWG1_ARUDO